MLRYFAALSSAKLILWCYLIWYLSTLAHHFDASPRLWLTSLGLSAVIGFALVLSVGGLPDRWTLFRLFLMPFCVSSFAALVKDAGFWLIVPPTGREQLVTVGACVAFILFVLTLKARSR